MTKSCPFTISEEDSTDKRYACDAICALYDKSVDQCCLLTLTHLASSIYEVMDMMLGSIEAEHRRQRQQTEI